MPVRNQRRAFCTRRRAGRTFRSPELDKEREADVFFFACFHRVRDRVADAKSREIRLPWCRHAGGPPRRAPAVTRRRACSCALNSRGESRVGTASQLAGVVAVKGPVCVPTARLLALVQRPSHLFARLCRPRGADIDVRLSAPQKSTAAPNNNPELGRTQRFGRQVSPHRAT